MVSISSNIRRRIKMTSKRLVEAMKEATTFTSEPSLSATTDRDKLDELNDRLLDLVTYKDKIGTSVNVLYECSRDWTDGIEKLSERERQDKLKIQDEFCKEENGDYVVLLDKSQELLDSLKMQEAALIKVIRALERKVERATTGASRAANATPSAAPPQVNLPLMDLPEFEGDVLKFAEFWDLFEATIDKNTVLGDRQKFSYLKKYLRGRGEKLIEGLSVTESNYTVAKELLTNSYGKKDYIVQALYRELEQLKKPQSSAASLRAFMQELEKICRQLEQLGEDLDQKQILVNLESKMPLNVLSEIAKAKNSGGTWTNPETTGDTVHVAGPTVSYGQVRRTWSLANVGDGLLRHFCDAVYGPNKGSNVTEAGVPEAGLNSNLVCGSFWPRVSRKAKKQFEVP